MKENNSQIFKLHLKISSCEAIKTTDTTNTQLYLQSAGTSSLINYKNSVYDTSNTWSAGISYDSTINNYYQISCSDNSRATLQLSSRGCTIGSGLNAGTNGGFKIDAKTSKILFGFLF